MNVSFVLLAAAAAVATVNAQQDCRDLARFECPTECSPTCGSDGRTYSNPCRLWFAQCTDAKLTKAGRGVCPGEVHWDISACAYEAGKDPRPPRSGPIEKDPVDSSETKTGAAVNVQRRM